MWPILRRMALGLSLIALASTLLLWTDKTPRRTPGAPQIPRVAIFKHASTIVLDEGIRGMIDALKESGFINGQTITLEMFNAEGDPSTGNTIAREITNGG